MSQQPESRSQSTMEEHLRWADMALVLVKNRLKQWHKLEDDAVEFQNLRAAMSSIKSALELLTPSETAPTALQAEYADRQEFIREKQNAALFCFLIEDPETGRHLLSLLQQGDVDALRRMIDRITASKLAADRHTTKESGNG